MSILEIGRPYRDRRSQRMTVHHQPIAAIDIGTNSAHLVIANVDEGGHLQILDTEKIALRLGEKIGPDGMLSEQAIDDTVDALKKMKQIADPLTSELVAVATHATRVARNHDELIERVREQTGIEISLIDGLEEGRLTYLGIRQGLPLDGKPVLTVDIGGGSTELVLANDDEIHSVHSIKVGAVTLSKRFFKDSSLKFADSVKQMEKQIINRLAPISTLVEQYPFTMAIASSGTAKALGQTASQVFSKKTLDDPNGFQFSADELRQLYERTIKLEQPKRIREAFDLDTNRADIILAGTAILNVITKTFGIKDWTVSSYSLREGLVVDTFQRTRGPIRVDSDDVRWRSVLNFANRHNLDQTYAALTTSLALKIYDAIESAFYPSIKGDLSTSNRDLLRAAVFLHEIGKQVSHPRYHKHSYYMLRNSNLLGFNQSEKQLIGLITRFHRKSPATKAKAKGDLFIVENLERINVLSSCLRIATALNRTRQGIVSDFKADALADGALRVTVETVDGHSAEAELFKLNQELPNLEKALGLTLCIGSPGGADK